MTTINQIQSLYEECNFEEVYKLCKAEYEQTQDDFGILYYLSASAFHTQKKDDAVNISKELILLDSNNANGYNLRLEILSYLKEYEELLECVEMAFENNLNDLNYIYFKALSLYSLKEYSKTIEYCTDIYTNHPQADFTCAFIAQCYLTSDLLDTKKAMQWINKAIYINPQAPGHLFIKGKTHKLQHNYQDAIELLQKSLNLSNGIDITVALNLAHCYCIVNKKNKAIKLLENAKKTYPKDDDILKILSTLYLSKKEFQKGFGLLNENIAEDAFLIVKDENIPLLTKDSNIVGSTIVIAENEGLGDNINFLRYTKTLLDMGAKKIYYYYERETLTSLLNSSDYIELLKDSDITQDMIDGMDYGIQIQQLPEVLTTSIETIPDNFNVFNHNYTQKISVDNNKLNIGFVYRGNPEHNYDSNRSIFDLSIFEKLFSIPDTIFYSLQYDNNEEVAKYQEKYPNIIDTKSQIQDMNDTADIIHDLDLVITIDSSIAHLSATFDKPTWIMLDTCNDWRWFVDTNTSFWYESVKLFRQKKPNQWRQVINSIYQNLIQLKDEKLI